MKTSSYISIGCFSGWDHIFFSTTPPDTDNSVRWVSDPSRFLEGCRIHDTPSSQNHPVRFISAGDVKPRCFLIESGMCDRIVPDFKSVHFRLLIQHRPGFFSITTVMMKVGDCLSLEVFHTAFLHADVLDLRCTLAPVVGDQRKYPRENLAV